MFNPKEHPHTRFNPLTREWVLVSPHRTKRPWQGQVERVPPEYLPPYDSSCYLCPGNSRAGGMRNPDYQNIFVFDNDFAALLPDKPVESVNEGGLLAVCPERGVCRVLCFSPRHDLTLARMEASAIRQVIDAWAEEYLRLGSLAFIDHVQIFENRGEMMGCSNPHPHCQIWATESIPNEVAKEQTSQAQYRADHQSCLLCDYLSQEAQSKERLVCENRQFAALVPFWAVWPFELLVVPKWHVASLNGLEGEERDALADILKRVTTRYDNLFEVSFPYTMGFHQQPTDGMAHEEWHLHAHFYPPLLRSATVRKFMVGFEMLAMPQRDIAPELAAERLRECSERHYAEG
jgi:UDPglucose--hexose-1-phosphate uridylyltransferase